jgi:hypothetical protein
MARSNDQRTGFEMPTAREIELDLALANPGWRLLTPPEPESPLPLSALQTPLGRRPMKVTKAAPGA